MRSVPGRNVSLIQLMIKKFYIEENSIFVIKYCLNGWVNCCYWWTETNKWPCSMNTKFNIFSIDMIRTEILRVYDY